MKNWHKESKIKTMKMSKDQKQTKQESSKPNCLNGLLQPKNLLPINIKGRNSCCTFILMLGKNDPHRQAFYVLCSRFHLRL